MAQFLMSMKMFAIYFYQKLNNILLLYNVLPINRYIGNITIKCHNKSMRKFLHFL